MEDVIGVNRNEYVYQPIEALYVSVGPSPYLDIRLPIGLPILVVVTYRVAILPLVACRDASHILVACRAAHVNVTCCLSSCAYIVLVANRAAL